MTEAVQDWGTSSPSVVIILVNWNGWRDSIACIESCLALDHSSSRIILCDNNSADGSVDAILSWARGERAIERDPESPVHISLPRLPRSVALLSRAQVERGDDAGGAELIVVSTGGNLGFAGGNNVGLRWAMSQNTAYAWLLNNDTVVPTGALTSLLARSRIDPDIGLCGSTMVEYCQPTVLQGYAAAIDMSNFRGRHLGAGKPLTDLAAVMLADPARRGEVIYPIGASILVSAAFLETVGLMEESYFLYYEEIDWVLRGRRQFRTAIAHDSIVYHKVGASAGSNPQGTSARSVGFLYRSRLRASRQLAPKRLPAVVIGIVEEAARALVRGRYGKIIGAIRALSGQVRVPNMAIVKKN